jgi:NAD+ diphosphatase
VAIIDGDRLLMARSASGLFRRFSLIAGYVQFGETLEEAVQREAREEVGLRVKNVRYYKSQPWAFSDTEMIGFFAELDGSPEIALDDGELAEACWFTRQDVPEPVSTISVGSELINLFRTGRVPPV